MKNNFEEKVLLFECPDKPGLVAQVSNLIFQMEGNILRLDQHTTFEPQSQFFMRAHFYLAIKNKEKFSSELNLLAGKVNAHYKLYNPQVPVRMGILVSKIDHCLFDLLYRQSAKELNIEIPMIISNHSLLAPVAERYNIPFYHLPIKPETKPEQEEKILKLVSEKTDFLVLARYMQILSRDFISHYNKDIINIHHSFLPSFKGAYPYNQAYDRGVKVIGATAHFVTADLDEGPIIEQIVERISHRDNPETMKLKGKNLEKLALASAVHFYTERKIIRYGNRTIVFS